jgi:hypothetical protein
MSLAFTIDNTCSLINCAERYDTIIASPIKNSVVYFLLHKDDGLVYIGQTKNIQNRLSQHRQSKNFDMVYIKKIPNGLEDYSKELEKLCLSYINEPTKYNVQYPKVPFYLSNKGNPLDKNNFNIWIEDKLREKQRRNEMYQRICAESVIRNHRYRKQRQEKNIFAKKPIRINDTSRLTI